MERFTSLTGIAAPLPMINVDTDKIIPKQFLKTIKRSGLAAGLFFDLRFDERGEERPEFVLNRPAYRRAAILVVGDNFGCGSSREHAPWALLDFGIRCIIAPSFADIFYNNCFKNGILPVVVAKSDADHLLGEAGTEPPKPFTVDLQAQEISTSTGRHIHFDIDPFRKRCLLNGLDEIDLTLEHVSAIDDFEARQRSEQPWLYR
jgi:3-isopropylmalate/(R)-2-methylmalate dehydratase small subunit